MTHVWHLSFGKGNASFVILKQKEMLPLLPIDYLDFFLSSHVAVNEIEIHFPKLLEGVKVTIQTKSCQFFDHAFVLVMPKFW